MSLAENPPPPLGPEWKPWGERLVSFLARTKTKLAYYIAGDTAAEDGVVGYRRRIRRPVEDVAVLDPHVGTIALA